MSNNNPTTCWCCGSDEFGTTQMNVAGKDQPVCSMCSGEDDGLRPCEKIRLAAPVEKLNKWKPPEVRFVEAHGTRYTRWDWGNKVVIHDVDKNQFVCCLVDGTLIHEMDNLKSALFWMLGSRWDRP